MSVAHAQRNMVRPDMGLRARRPGRNNARTRGGPRIRPGRAVVLAFWAALAGLFFAAVTVGLLFGFRWLTNNPFFDLTRIEVRGVERLTVAEVAALSGATLGSNVVELPVSEVEERLTGNPWIASAAVKRMLPGGLRIVVRERRPVWWMHDDAGLRYADVQGRPFAAVNEDRFTSCPQLIVEHGADPTDAMERVGSLERAGLPLALKDAAWVRVMPDGGMEMAFDGQGLTVRMDPGTMGWDESMARLAVAWRDMERRGEISALRRLTVAGGKVWARLATR